MKTNQLTRIALLVSFAATAPWAIAAETPASELKDPKMEAKVAIQPGTPVVEPGTLTTVIQDSVTFTTLTKALKAAELDITLGQKGTFTIFAPTDEAFDKLPAGTLGKLMLPENKEKLRSLLLYHVIAGKVMAADLKDGDVKTMNGEKVEVDVDDGKVTINNAKVFSTDVMASNGVMHSVGEVIVPESLEGFANLDD